MNSDTVVLLQGGLPGLREAEKLLLSSNIQAKVIRPSDSKAASAG